jgi:hypothetical protein
MSSTESDGVDGTATNAPAPDLIVYSPAARQAMREVLTENGLDGWDLERLANVLTGAAPILERLPHGRTINQVLRIVAVIVRGRE